MTSGRFGKLFAPFLLGGSIVGGKQVYDSLAPETYAGTDIPLATENQKISQVTDAHIYDSLAQEYLYGEGADLRAKTADCVHEAQKMFGQHAAVTVLSIIDSDDPYVTRKLAQFISPADHPAHPRRVDLEGLSYWIGDGLLS